MKLAAEETATASPSITWGDDQPAPVNAPVNATAAGDTAANTKDATAAAKKISKAVKPKKDKPVKVSKSKAAELKEALEKRQLGDKSPATPKASKKKAAKPAAKVAIKKLKPKTAQLDMVTEGKLLVPEPNSPLYKVGKRLSEVVEQETLIKDEKADAMQEVVKAMRKARRYNYKVRGYIFEIVHKGAEDKVRIIKPK